MRTNRIAKAKLGAGAGLLGIPLVLAACGSSASGSANAGGGSASTSAGTQANTAAPAIKLASVTGVGSVLVDGTSNVLYTPDQEADGKIRCTDTCLDAWPAVLASPGSLPTVAGATGTFGTVTRPDGKTQLTYKGHPLYTFAFDKSGSASGNDVHDHFGNEDFSWHAVTATGTAAVSSPGDDHGGSSQGSTAPSPSARGGYNY